MVQEYPGFEEVLDKKTFLFRFVLTPACPPWQKK